MGAGQTFNNNSISEIPIWLMSYSDSNVASVYWILTSNQSNLYVNWYIHSGSVGYDYLYGIRPVITISKSQLG